MEPPLSVFLTLCLFVQGTAYKCYDCRYGIDEGCGPLIDATKLQADNKVKMECAACAIWSTHVRLSNATVYRYCAPYTKECRTDEKLCQGDLCNGDVPGFETGHANRPNINGIYFLMCFTICFSYLASYFSHL